MSKEKIEVARFNKVRCADQIKVEGGPQAPYRIEKIIELESNEYVDFIRDFWNEYIFLNDNADKMYIDNDGVWNCLLIKEKGRHDGILVNTEGHSYSKYTAYLEDTREKMSEEDVIECLQEAFEIINEEDRLDLYNVTFKNWTLKPYNNNTFSVVTRGGDVFDIKVTRK